MPPDSEDRVREARREARVQARAEKPADTIAIDEPAGNWQRAAQISTVGLFVLALAAAAYFAQQVLIPVVLAWAVATIILPAVRRLTNLGIKREIGVVLVTIALFLVAAGLIILLSTPLVYWVGRAGELALLIRQKMALLSSPLSFLHEVGDALRQVTGEQASGIKVEQPGTNIVTAAVSLLTPVASQFIMFFGALVFYQLYYQELRRAVVLLVQGREARLSTLRILQDIDRNMSTYFGTLTVVNLCLAAATTALAWAAHLPSPFLWGVLAGLLNFIPYVGPALIIATLAVVGFVALPTLSQAAVAPLAFLVMTTFEGQFITPTLVGKRLTLNPFAVFLSIAFWTWMWGVMGAFLGVPILMAATVVFRELLGEDKPALPE